MQPNDYQPLVLAGPLRWQVGEASNAYVMGEPAVDGGFDQIGRKESQRNCHIDLARTAVFPHGDAVCSCRWISDDLQGVQSLSLGAPRSAVRAK